LYFEQAPDNPLFTIRYLQRALKKARANTETLTTVHTLLVHVAIRGKAYHVAAQVCDETVFDVDEEGCDPRNMLLYFYYGGLAYVGLKRWADALRFFRRVVTAPVSVLSQICAEAFKKMMLVSLIHLGRFSADLPRYTSTAVVRSQKQAFPKYHELCNAYQTRNQEELEKVAAEHADIWKDDQNTGLVKQVIKSLVRGNIRRNTQTYLTMSLADLAKSAGLPEDQAQAHLLDMIQQKQISAQINQKDHMVAFLEKQQAYDNATALHSLHERLSRSIKLAERVGQLRDTIETSPKYASRILQQERSGGKGGMGDLDAEDGEGMGHLQ
jgi:COP9 signalosome complex subunit 3